MYYICVKTKIEIKVLNTGIIIRVIDNKILTKYKDKDGYEYITLKKGKIRVNYKVHRLVGLLYLLNPNNKPCINHKDGIKSNNNYTNLEWCTYSENMKHAVNIGLSTNASQKGDNHNTTKHLYSKIQLIRSKYKSEKISMRKLAKEFNCSSGYISDIINNKIRINK